MDPAKEQAPIAGAREWFIYTKDWKEFIRKPAQVRFSTEELLDEAQALIKSEGKGAECSARWGGDGRIYVSCNDEAFVDKITQFAGAIDKHEVAPPKENKKSPVAQNAAEIEWHLKELTRLWVQAAKKSHVGTKDAMTDIMYCSADGQMIVKQLRSLLQGSEQKV